MNITYSFIIPHKNCPNLLQRCVDSIPERDDVEVIVVDDNSEEGKKPSLKERKNLQVILLDSTHSKGAGRARNVGLEHAKGKWLLFADADDYYNISFLDKLDKYKEKEIAVLYFNFDYRDGKTGELLGPLYFKKYFENYDKSQKAIDQIKFHHNVPWTKMVRHSFLKVNNIRFEEVPNGNDILFSMLAGYYAKNIEVEKTPLYIYLKNEGSILHQKHLSYQSRLCKLKHIVQQNEFYEYVGHKEWKKNVIKLLIMHVYQGGAPFLPYLLVHAKEIYKDRKAWISKVMK